MMRIRMKQKKGWRKRKDGWLIFMMIFILQADSPARLSSKTAESSSEGMAWHAR
jgi:hypothetical protein